MICADLEQSLELTLFSCKIFYAKFKVISIQTASYHTPNIYKDGTNLNCIHQNGILSKEMMKMAQ